MSLVANAAISPGFQSRAVPALLGLPCSAALSALQEGLSEEPQPLSR